MEETEATAPDYSNTPIDQLWAEWKVQHAKTYNTKEDEEYRFGVFKESLQQIQEQNARYRSGESTYYCGLNHLADRKPSEVCCGGVRVPREDEK